MTIIGSLIFPGDLRWTAWLTWGHSYGLIWRASLAACISLLVAGWMEHPAHMWHFAVFRSPSCDEALSLSVGNKRNLLCEWSSWRVAAMTRRTQRSLVLHTYNLQYVQSGKRPCFSSSDKKDVKFKSLSSITRRQEDLQEPWLVLRKFVSEARWNVWNGWAILRNTHKKKNEQRKQTDRQTDRQTDERTNKQTNK